MAPNRSVLASVWGPYSHVSLLEERNGNRRVVLGAYDGIVHWTVAPDMNDGFQPMMGIFNTAVEGGDIAVLGAGGGRQVDLALRRHPHSVVAVDVIPDVFPLFQGPLAWANERAYQSPLVESTRVIACS